MAEELGCCELISLEAPEDQSLASDLVPALKASLLRLSRLKRTKAPALQTLSTLRRFAAAFKVSVGGIKMGLSEPPAVLADSGNLEVDLPELLLQVAQVARAAGRVLVVLLEEVQYLSAEELCGLIVALHRAGRERGAHSVLPYFLQEWGKHAWNAVPSSSITLTAVQPAHATATAAFAQSFFRVRFDRLTPKKLDYLGAMASLGPGLHRSGAIAAALKRKVEALAPLRTGLIRKGMIWRPAHAQTAFTVPMSDDFMQRGMPKNTDH